MPSQAPGPGRDVAEVEPRRDVVAVVAARDEEARVGPTVLALLAIPEVIEVVVVDDGSRDRTSERGAAAGGRVLRLSRPVGKGGAIEAWLGWSEPASVVLLADADLGPSAERLRDLLVPLAAGDADLAVAVLPRPPVGGFGLVRGAAGRAVARLSGFRALAPLSGQRAVTRECLEACRPLARGFGIEAAMTADAVRLGFRVVEVPADVEHAYTGRDPAGFLHRARQGAHVARAMAPRLAGWR